jgi:MFS family permease
MSQRHRASWTFLFITVFVDMLGYGMVIPLLPFFVQAQLPGALVVGLLASLYALMQFFSVPLLGSLSDHYGRRPLLLVCLLGTGLAYLLLGLAQTIGLLVVAVLLDSATGGSQAVAQAYVADNTPPEERARGMGGLGAAFGLGLLLGPALGGLLSGYGLHVPAFAAAALALSNAAVGWARLPESLPPERRHFAWPASQFNPLVPLGQALRLPGLRPLLLATFLLNLAFAGLYTNFPLFSQARFGWDAFDNGLFFAFVGLCAVLTQGVLLGRLQPWLGEKRLVAGGLALTALLLALLALTPAAWMLYPVVGLLALGTGLAIPAVTSLISQAAPTHAQGQVLGGTNALLSLAMLLAPTMAGLLFDLLGTGAPYWAGSFLAAAALFVGWPVLRQPARRAYGKGPA